MTTTHDCAHEWDHYPCDQGHYGHSTCRKCKMTVQGTSAPFDQALSKIDQRLVAQEKAIVDATEMVAELMQQERITKTELARRINKTPQFITKLLNGNNFTLRTLSDVLGAMGYSLKMEAVPCRK